jgi:hypothetical protein
VILIGLEVEMLGPELALLALAVAAVARASASVLQTWIKQESFTRRLTKALEDAEPQQRPDILVALSQVESRSAGEPDEDKADSGSLTDERHHLPALILASKRVHEHHGD